MSRGRWTKGLLSVLYPLGCRRSASGAVPSRRDRRSIIQREDFKWYRDPRDYLRSAHSPAR